MGVPAFFGWLTRKYPAILERCIEKGAANADPADANAAATKSDDASAYASQAAQVNIQVEIKEGEVPKETDVTVEVVKHEFDNFYIDMNGIIHNISHGDAVEGVRSDESMKLNLYEKLDLLMSFVRPKAVVFLAIDGVAPRAKLNQQRSRRFKSAKDTKEEIAKMKEEWIAAHPDGEPFPEITPWDSNQISPGTEFMQKISVLVQEYIKARLESDPSWKNLKVIFSDSSVPGEGEHKILDFIRFNRQSPDYNPQTRHCFYGPDADLLFLGLSLHERFFSVLREQDAGGARRLVEPFNAVPSNCVFIGKIPQGVTEDYLRIIAAKFGKVEQIVIARDMGTGKPRGHAFVRFDSIDSAAKLALSTVRINKEKVLFTKFENPDIVEREANRVELLGTVRDTIRVGFIPYSATETELGKLLEDAFGKVVEVRIITDSNQQSKGFGYVQFEKQDSALTAIKTSLQMGARRLKFDIANRKKAAEKHDGQPLQTGEDVAHDPAARNERISEFLRATGRYENNIAYRYLYAANWDVDAAVKSLKAGDPVPDVKNAANLAAEEATPSVSSVSEESQPSAAPVESIAETDAVEEVDDGDESPDGPKKASRKLHVFVHIHILQEYLQHEFDFAFSQTKTPFDLQRVVDDFVLICMMCGNDFLPHIPMLDIRKGAIDVLLYVYKLVFPNLGGYLVEPGRINFDRLAVFLAELTRLESHFMVRRFSSDDEKKVRQEARAAALAAGLPDPTLNPDGTPIHVKSTPDMYAPLISTSEGALWKQRYYKETFNLPVLEQSFVDGIATNFVEGLFWVYTYYYYGVDQSSWSWYYPHHFAPLLCDVHRVLTTTYKGKDMVKLDVGAPLRPLEQLLAVLPPDSASVLPEAFRHLVLSPTSPIIDYYPDDFEVVLEPGRPSWLAISILNFIDIGRLLKAAADVEKNLSAEEKNRNTNQEAPVLVVRKGDSFVSSFFAKLASSAVPVRGAGVPFTADLLPGSPSDRFKSLVSDELRLAYCRSVSGTQLPLRVGRLEGASMSLGPSLLSKEEVNKSLPKKKQYSYVNRPAHHLEEEAAAAASTSSSGASPAAPAPVLIVANTVEAAIDLGKSECMNDKKEHPWQHAFSSLRGAAAAAGSECYLESDVDAQLLINLQFKVPAKISSIAMHTAAAHVKSGPAKIHLFANRTNIGFDTVESLKADQVVQLSEEQLLKGASINLAATKFSSVHSLSIFVETNQSDSETTAVHLIKLDGTLLASLEQKTLSPSK